MSLNSEAKPKVLKSLSKSYAFYYFRFIFLKNKEIERISSENVTYDT